MSREDEVMSYMLVESNSKSNVVGLVGLAHLNETNCGSDSGSL